MKSLLLSAAAVCALVWMAAPASAGDCNYGRSFGRSFQSSHFGHSHGFRGHRSNIGRFGPGHIHGRHGFNNYYRGGRYGHYGFGPGLRINGRNFSFGIRF